MSQKNLAFIIAPGFVALPLYAMNREESIPWTDDFDVAREKATALNRPILVDFYADWCEPSVQLDREVFTDDRVVAPISEHFVACRIDVSNLGGATEKSRRALNFVKAQGLSRFPVCGLFRPDGCLIGLFEPHPLRPLALLSQLTALLQGS